MRRGAERREEVRKGQKKLIERGRKRRGNEKKGQ